jgi:enoyl-CoA hydratase/carnithine racemase
LTAARESQDAGAAFFMETLAACSALMEAISQSPKPVIAEVQGIATAAGCQLVAACDLAYAADTAAFATPGVNIGLFCTTPSVPLVRSIGTKAAMEMLLTGDAISAAAALAVGLINAAVSPGLLKEYVREIAQKIASKPSGVVNLGKTAVRHHASLTLHAAYQYASEVMTDNLLRTEAIAGIGNFLDRGGRKPRA